MKTDVYTPMQVFHLPQRLVVPLFQRAYVWDEEEQWAPLWQDLRRMAELRLSEPSTSASHFLGAVVLQADEGQQGRLQTSNIIDGQQRITTLQLVMDAIALVLEAAGHDNLSGQLELLTHNQDNYVRPGQSRLKLRHTNRDQAAFDEVMDSEPPVFYSALDHSTSLLVRAHEYFAVAATEWLGSTDETDYVTRADALVDVLTHGLQLVVINLAASENSQEIFETLNARGMPLTAADLIKNFVFQRLSLEEADTSRAYTDDWPFDTKFWETEVSVGRYLVSRSSLFLNQWLISRTGEEISPNSTFTRFKSFVENESPLAMADLLPVIKHQADQYAGWTESAMDRDRQLSAVEMAVYRMQANNIELLKPILIWLHAPGRVLSPYVVDGVIAAVESWIVRRQLLRLTSSDLGRIVADIIRTYRDAPADDLPERVRTHISRLNVSSTYWPGDEEVRNALATEPIYRRFNRGRLRMLMEAIENHYRSHTNQPQVPRRGYPIEHVMPQKWETNWPVEGLEAEQFRSAHIHRLGNLTLLTGPLNSKVSNGAWEAKRAAFADHDTLLLTSRLLAAAHDSLWNEQLIDARTASLIQQLLEIWPVPNDHFGQVVDPQSKEPDWIEVKDLVAAGILEAGTSLTPRPGKWANIPATVRSDGLIEVDGKTFDTPSGAGKYLRGGSTNGWYFWRLPDGRTLRDLRAEFRDSNGASA